MITDEGLIGAGPTDRRCKVTCVRGARDLDEMESTLFKMWRYRTPDEAHAVLVSPDVTVTNQKDKNAQLPKILTLATQVRCCRLGQRLLHDATQCAQMEGLVSAAIANRWPTIVEVRQEIAVCVADAERLLADAAEGARDAEAAMLIDERAFLETSIAEAREAVEAARVKALAALDAAPDGTGAPSTDGQEAAAERKLERAATEASLVDGISERVDGATLAASPAL